MFVDGDYEICYDFVIVYKEMGLFEDVIVLFEFCVVCPVWGLDSL